MTLHRTLAPTQDRIKLYTVYSIVELIKLQSAERHQWKCSCILVIRSFLPPQPALNLISKIEMCVSEVRQTRCTVWINHSCFPFSFPSLSLHSPRLARDPPPPPTPVSPSHYPHRPTVPPLPVSPPLTNKQTRLWAGSESAWPWTKV